MTFPDELRALVPLHTAAQIRDSIPGLPLRTVEEWLGGRRTPPLWTQGLILNHLRVSQNLGASNHA